MCQSNSNMYFYEIAISSTYTIDEGIARMCRMNIDISIVNVFKCLKVNGKIYKNHCYLFQCSFFFTSVWSTSV